MGITASPSFVEEPGCNRVVERFIGLLKQQCIRGHRFRNLKEVTEKIAEFIDRYNQEWLMERLGFKSPVAARLVPQAEVVLC